MWPVVFTQAARAELIDAQDWYEAEAPGLGRRFRAEIDTAVQRMADNPRRFPVVVKTLRRARAKKFLYALFFLIEPDPLLSSQCDRTIGMRKIIPGPSAPNSLPRRENHPAFLPAQQSRNCRGR